MTAFVCCYSYRRHRHRNILGYDSGHYKRPPCCARQGTNTGALHSVVVAFCSSRLSSNHRAAPLERVRRPLLSLAPTRMTKMGYAWASESDGRGGRTCCESTFLNLLPFLLLTPFLSRKALLSSLINSLLQPFQEGCDTRGSIWRHLIH